MGILGPPISAPPLSSPAESLFPSSWPAQSPSSAKSTKFGLLLTPCRELCSLQSNFLTGEKVPGSMQRSPEGSKAKILRGPHEITGCGEAAELTETGCASVTPRNPTSPYTHWSVSCDSKQQSRYQSMPFVPGGGPRGSVSMPKPLLSKNQVNMFSII